MGMMSLPMFARLAPDDDTTMVEALASLGQQAEQVTTLLSA
jgi:hypothetical protein